MLPTTICDAHGTSNCLQVGPEGEISIVMHAHPPRDEATEAYPWTSYFQNGGSNDMRVNGATTPQVFEVSSSTERDIYVKTISIYIADNTAAIDLFGALAALTNGVKFGYRNNVLGEVVIEEGLKSNLEMLRIGQNTQGVGDKTTAYQLSVAGAGADAYIPLIDLSATFGFPWGLRLKKNDNDSLFFTVQDDLSTGLDGFNIKAFGVQI